MWGKWDLWAKMSAETEDWKREEIWWGLSQKGGERGGRRVRGRGKRRWQSREGWV